MPRRLLALVLLALVLAAPVRAERLGEIRLPDHGIADLPTGPIPQTLLDPPPLRDSWAKPGHQPLGVTLSNYDLTEEQIEAAKATGCGMVRLRIPMEHFLDDAMADWATLDQVISRLRRAGLEVVAVLDADIAVRDFYRDFARKVAERYRQSITYFQILDNINYKIGLPTREYSDLVSIVRPAIKLAHPDAILISGGIRGSDLTYLEMLENQRAIRNLDIIALNLYPPRDGIESVTSQIRTEHCLPYVADVTAWARQRGKAVWVTALGCSTDSTWVGMDEVTQASAYARGVLILGWLGAERVFLASIQDIDPTNTVPAQCTGVLNINGQPKASFYTLRSLADVVGGAYHAATPFMSQGQTHQSPREEDVYDFNARVAEYSRSAFENANDPLAQSLNPLDAFEVKGLPVYSFWFYAPAQQEYRLIYWMSTEPTIRTLLTVAYTSPHFKPLESYLKPIEAYQMLDPQPVKPNYFNAANLVVIPYQPLDILPGVIRLQAADPRPSRASL